MGAVILRVIPVLGGMTVLIVFARLLADFIPAEMPRDPEISQRAGKPFSRAVHAAGFYFLAMIALAGGAFHLLISSLPGISDWLSSAGQAGLNLGYAAGMHLLFEGGLLLLAMGTMITILPRISGKAVFSRLLSRLSVILTATGVFGRYLAESGTGLYEQLSVQNGNSYIEARLAAGKWHNISPAVFLCFTAFGLALLTFNMYLTLKYSKRGESSGSEIKRSTILLPPLVLLTALGFLIEYTLLDTAIRPPAGIGFASFLFVCGLISSVALSFSDSRIGSGIEGYGAGILFLIAAVEAMITQIFGSAVQLEPYGALFALAAGVLILLLTAAAALTPELFKKDTPRYGRPGLPFVVAGSVIAGFFAFLGRIMGRLSPLPVSFFSAAFNIILQLSLLVILSGILMYAIRLYRDSREYRIHRRKETHSFIQKYDGKNSHIRKHVGSGSILVIEAIFGILGFPGIGWLFSGQAFIGLVLVFVSPVILWVIIPVFLSVFRYVSFVLFGPLPMLLYLVGSTLISVAFLWRSLRQAHLKAVVR